MSLLPGDRFAASKPESDVPKQVRISRVLLWVQAVIGLLLSAFIILGTYQQQQLSNSELAKLFKERMSEKDYNAAYKDSPPTQELFSYPLLYLMVALLVVLMVALVWCALKLTQRQKHVRIATIAIEGVLVPVSLLELSQIGCVLVVPAMAVIMLLLSRQAKDWYAAAS